METKRTLLAIVISFAILFGYYALFPQPTPQPEPVETTVESTSGENSTSQAVTQAIPATAQPSSVAQVANHADAIDIEVETDLYTAVFTENGGALKSLILKAPKETKDKDSPGKDLVNSDETLGFPLQFSWGSAAGQGLYYKSASRTVSFVDGKGQLVMEAQAGAGLVITRTYTFAKDSYLIDLQVTVKNLSGQPLQGIPQLHQVNTPFQKGGSPADRFLFRGPETYINGELKEIKADDFEEGPVTVQGDIDWAGYGANYFLRAIVPLENSGVSYEMRGKEDLTFTRLTTPWRQELRRSTSTRFFMVPRK